MIRCAAYFMVRCLVHHQQRPGSRHPKVRSYPFILLAMIVSLEAVILSTFVLMKQNWMQRKTDQRDHLNLQIDLLAEKELTKVLQVLMLICTKLEIEEPEADKELKKNSATHIHP